LRLSAPDWHIIALAFLAGCLAALAQACIPYFTGLVIDYASIEPDRVKFLTTIKRLVAVAVLCGLLTGSRGGLFTVAMSKLNVRIRKRLFKSLLAAEVGFYDTTKTGEITSRLSADTSTVSDSVCLNLNVMLRSIAQAAMVLAFMFTASWRLTVVRLRKAES
ncbi:ABC transmembrane type-1 domain-containing protein, partial [Haematococcus lacustris]